MRRSEKEVKERSAIDEIIRGTKVCRLGLCDEAGPYIVPLCFGYDGNVLYFHGAPEGKKIDMLRKNNRVCVEFDITKGMVSAEKACGWNIKYQSVIGFGRATVVDDLTEKRKGLEILMSQYTDKTFSFPEQAIQHTCVIKVDLESITGKHSVD